MAREREYLCKVTFNGHRFGYAIMNKGYAYQIVGIQVEPQAHAIVIRFDINKGSYTNYKTIGHASQALRKYVQDIDPMFHEYHYAKKSAIEQHTIIGYWD